MICEADILRLTAKGEHGMPQLIGESVKSPEAPEGSALWKDYLGSRIALVVILVPST